MSDSESSVPVPRPSEGDETPLTYEQEIHSLLYKARTWGRDLKAIFERERATPGALSPEERRINRVCIENLADDLARIDAAIPLAEARRSSSSPSVPEATQDDIRGRAYVAGWLDGETHGATHGVGTGYEQARAKAEGQAARYVAAYKPAKLDKPISPAVPSSEEAANSDTRDAKVKVQRDALNELLNTACRYIAEDGKTETANHLHQEQSAVLWEPS